MSDPRPLAERIEAALTVKLMAELRRIVDDHQTFEWMSSDLWNTTQRTCQERMRAVLTSALLAALEEPVIGRTHAAHYDADMTGKHHLQPAEGPTPAPGDVAKMAFKVLSQIDSLMGIGHTVLNAALPSVRRDAAALYDTLKAAPPDDTLARVARLARQAINGWACYAKRKIELDDIARLHRELDEALRPDAPRAETP